ncbi:2-iminobutanoate/2-iminopropanoate deaminase [Novosphingobium sp. 1529]|uniref:RidA family protein n=1 Tax=Novosphingobium sp. 1529 TaxID=3156424 RepID=UPI001493E9C3
MTKRQSIFAEGFSHGALPIPAASRIGPFIASGNIFGFDYAAGAHPETADAQAALMFQHMQRIVEAAGGTLDDILKVTVYVQNDSVRAAVDPEWIKAFPDPASRPARQTMVQAAMPGNRLIACDILAVASAA